MVSLKTVLFSEVGIGQIFISTGYHGSKEYIKLSSSAATSDDMFEEGFVGHEPVQIEIV